MNLAYAKPSPTVRRSLRAGAIAILAVPTTWWAIRSLLASDRGIDLTDESLYLLDADPPGRYDAFGFPYGWITGPMFRAVDMDIARFRTLAGVLLVLATALLAAGSCAPVQRACGHRLAG